MINLSRTCKPLATLFKRAVETKWRINTYLRRFVRDPFKFREALGKCDGLIAGGFALQFFDRVYWPEAEMVSTVPASVKIENSPVLAP